MSGLPIAWRRKPNPSPTVRVPWDLVGECPMCGRQLARYLAPLGGGPSLTYLERGVEETTPGTYARTKGAGSNYGARGPMGRPFKRQPKPPRSRYLAGEARPPKPSTKVAVPTVTEALAGDTGSPVECIKGIERRPEPLVVICHGRGGGRRLCGSAIQLVAPRAG